MKRYLRAMCWFAAAIVVFGLGCQPKPGTKTEAKKEVKVTEAKPAEKAVQPAKETAKKAEAKVAPEAAVAVPGKAESNAPAKAIDANSVAVSVNGHNITEGDITVKVKPQMERISRQLPAHTVQEYEKQLRDRALDGMVIEQLLDEQVKAGNIAVTDADVNDYLGQIAANQKMPVADLKSLVEASGQDFGVMKQQTKKRIGYQKLMEGQWAGKINTADADIKKYYDENAEKFKTPEQIRASHILIKPDPNGDPNQAKAAAKSKAEGLLKKVKKGADFAELAKANSACPSAAKGGDLGLFSRGRMVKPFEDAAFALKVGQVSGVVETQFGYHIIKVTEHQDAGTVPFEQAKEDIAKMLMQQKQGELAREYIDSLKAKASIVYPAGAKPAGEESKAVEMPKK